MTRKKTRMRRVDRIREILEEFGGRARVRNILQFLREREDNESIANSAVSIAVNAENNRLDELGEGPLFRTSRSGEEWGWIRLEAKTSFEPGTAAEDIENTVIEANRKIDAELQARLESMDWRVFESTFLAEVFEKLGFQEVEVTQATRDGGADARVTYKRGIVEEKAIVSSKRWASRSAVSVEEVRMLRGIKGDEDTAIIITTGTPHGYGSPAEIEADLRAAGFDSCALTQRDDISAADSSERPAIANCQGTPLLKEIEARDPGGLERATAVATAALRERYGEGPIQGKISAVVVAAS